MNSMVDLLFTMYCRNIILNFQIIVLSLRNRTAYTKVFFAATTLNYLLITSYVAILLLLSNLPSDNCFNLYISKLATKQVLLKSIPYFACQEISCKPMIKDNHCAQVAMLRLRVGNNIEGLQRLRL